MSPMTFIVVAVLTACLLVGVILLFRSRGRRTGGGNCPRCAHQNDAPAKFCALCGAPLEVELKA